MYVKPGVTDGSQLHLTGNGSGGRKPKPWPGAISIISKTPSATNVCKAGHNRCVATSTGRKWGRWAETGTFGHGRFRLFGKRRRRRASMKTDVTDGSQLRLARKGFVGRGEISLIWKTPSVLDVCKARCKGRVATSLGRKTETMPGNRARWPGSDFAYLENTADN